MKKVLSKSFKNTGKDVVLIIQIGQIKVDVFLAHGATFTVEVPEGENVNFRTKDDCGGKGEFVIEAIAA